MVVEIEQNGITTLKKFEEDESYYVINNGEYMEVIRRPGAFINVEVIDNVTYIKFVGD